MLYLNRGLCLADRRIKSGVRRLWRIRSGVRHNRHRLIVNSSCANRLRTKLCAHTHCVPQWGPEEAPCGWYAVCVRISEKARPYRTTGQPDPEKTRMRMAGLRSLRGDSVELWLAMPPYMPPDDSRGNVGPLASNLAQSLGRSDRESCFGVFRRGIQG